MDLYIKRFTVRYGGKDYGPGKVIYGVPDKLAKTLVAESNGAIELLEKHLDDDLAGSVPRSDGKVDVFLPPVDPKATIKKGAVTNGA